MLLEQGCKRNRCTGQIVNQSAAPCWYVFLSLSAHETYCRQIEVVSSTILILNYFFSTIAKFHHFLAAWTFIYDKIWEHQLGDKHIFCPANTLALYITRSLVWQPQCGLCDQARLLYHMKTCVGNDSTTPNLSLAMFSLTLFRAGWRKSWQMIYNGRAVSL